MKRCIIAGSNKIYVEYKDAQKEVERLRSIDTDALIKDAERWRKHGPILIKLIEELVDEGVDMGTIGEGTKLRIDGFLEAAMGGE